MRVLTELNCDTMIYGLAVWVTVDSKDEFRIIRLNPRSSLFIEENEDAYVQNYYS